MGAAQRRRMVGVGELVADSVACPHHESESGHGACGRGAMSVAGGADAVAKGCTGFDVFRCCRFLRSLGNIMVLVVLGLVGLSYYAVEFKSRYGLLSAEAEAAGVGMGARVGVGSVFSAAVAMLLWSYIATVTTDAGAVPDGYQPYLFDDADCQACPESTAPAVQEGESEVGVRFEKQLSAGDMTGFALTDGLGDGNGQPPIDAERRGGAAGRQPADEESSSDDNDDDDDIEAGDRASRVRLLQASTTTSSDGGETTGTMTSRQCATQYDALRDRFHRQLLNPNIVRSPRFKKLPEHLRPRYCFKCNQFKPRRTHHCSLCNRCVLKMDHHCVWVANCVGAGNYKMFILFLVYTLLSCTMATLLMFPDFIEFFDASGTAAARGKRGAGDDGGSPLDGFDPSQPTVVHAGATPGDPGYVSEYDGVFGAGGPGGEDAPHTSRRSDLAVLFLSTILDISLSISIVGFLIMHANLIRSNRTTIELFEKPFEYENMPRPSEEIGFVARKRKSRLYMNVEEVFGSNPFLWLLPVHSESDLRSQLLHLNPSAYIDVRAIREQLLSTHL